MDYSNLSENIKASKAADMAYARWYRAQSDEKKAGMIMSAYHFVADRIRSQVLKLNPFANKTDVTWRFIEITQKDKYPPDVFAFMEKQMQKRSEKEWQERFRAMKKELKWSYADIARFIGAENEASVRASINRKVPAFGKLAVCVFEAVQNREEE
ncbi:MAG: hypothetical protein AAFO82_01835 [Bacteroidota bacterium]